jgi:hypothetical protein
MPPVITMSAHSRSASVSSSVLRLTEIAVIDQVLFLLLIAGRRLEQPRRAAAEDARRSRSETSYINVPSMSWNRTIAHPAATDSEIRTL